MISRKLRDTVKLSWMHAYEIAYKAKVSSSTLSAMINYREDVKYGDPRVKRIAKILGISWEECFEPDDEERPAREESLSGGGR